MKEIIHIRDGEYGMELSNSDKVLISKLKGKISKALNVRSKLPKLESSSLEKVYKMIDRLILQSEDVSDVEIFRDSLSNEYGIIENTKKKYVKEHILPLINIAVTRDWGSAK